MLISAFDSLPGNLFVRILLVLALVSIVIFLTWQLVDILIDACRRFFTKDPADPSIEAKPSVPTLTHWPSLVGSVYFSCLYIIIRTSSNYSANPSDPLDQQTPGTTDLFWQHLPEVLMIAVAILWIATSLARSSRQLMLNMLFFAPPLFAIFALLLLQTPLAFWATTAVLTLIVMREIYYQHGKNRLLVQLAHTIIIFAAFASGLHIIATYFFPELSAELSAQFDFITLFRARLIFLMLFIAVILLATAINTFNKFSFQYQDFIPIPRERSLFVELIYPFIITVNVILNFIVFVGRFLSITLTELFKFLWDVVLSRPLWKVAAYVVVTAGCLFTLAADVLFVGQPLSIINQAPSIFIDFDNDLLAANISLCVAFLLAMLCVLALAQIWLPRNSAPEARQVTFSRFVIAASAIYICIWFATVTYFPVLNFSFGLGASQLNWPGVYTVAGIVLAASFAAFAAVLGNSKTPVV